MAEIDSRNTRLQSYTTTAENIKLKIQDVAENKNVTIVDGTDTPLTVLTKIDNATVVTPSGTKSITSNGSNIDVSAYAKADVSVPTHEGEPIEISTSAGMSAVLIAENVGKVYRYTGTTDANYTNGDLYEVEASS